MATRTERAPAAEPLRPGVDDQGRAPLPWLAEALAGARALARSHALLLHGPAGGGHLELALTHAQTLLCEAGPAADGPPALACGRCGSCRLVASRSHPDLLVAVPDALRQALGWLADDEGNGRSSKADAKPSRDLRVEQVRQAIAWSQQTSGRGRGKVLVLHPADALNDTAANALLKTLEEPPGGLRLVLTSADPERLLPTVRSRCQRLALPLPPAELARDWLRGRGLADADALLAVAGGSPLEALAWAEAGVDGDWLATLAPQVAAGQGARLAELAALPLPRAIDLLLKLAHDAMRVAVGGTPVFLPAEGWPPGADLGALAAWQRALLRAARHDEHPWNAGLLVESLLLQAAACWPEPGARGGMRRPAPAAAGVGASGRGPSLHSGR